MIKKYLLVGIQVFLMQGFYAGHFISPVQKFIFSFAHLVEGKELDPEKSHIRKEGGYPFRIGELCVEAGDHGDPGQNVEALLLCPPKVFKDQYVIDAGPFPVFIRIIMFYIEKEKIEKGGKPVKDVFADTAGGLNGGMDAFLPEAEDQRLCKVRRCHAFSSGDSHPAAGFFIKTMS